MTIDNILDDPNISTDEKFNLIRQLYGQEKVPLMTKVKSIVLNQYPFLKGKISEKVLVNHTYLDELLYWGYRAIEELTGEKVTRLTALHLIPQLKALLPIAKKTLSENLIDKKVGELESIRHFIEEAETFLESQPTEDKPVDTMYNTRTIKDDMTVSQRMFKILSELKGHVIPLSLKQEISNVVEDYKADQENKVAQGPQISLSEKLLKSVLEMINLGDKFKGVDHAFKLSISRLEKDYFEYIRNQAASKQSGGGEEIPPGGFMAVNDIVERANTYSKKFDSGEAQEKAYEDYYAGYDQCRLDYKATVEKTAEMLRESSRSIDFLRNQNGDLNSIIEEKNKQLKKRPFEKGGVMPGDRDIILQEISHTAELTLDSTKNKQPHIQQVLTRTALEKILSICKRAISGESERHAYGIKDHIKTFAQEVCIMLNDTLNKILLDPNGGARQGIITDIHNLADAYNNKGTEGESGKEKVFGIKDKQNSEEGSERNNNDLNAPETLLSFVMRHIPEEMDDEGDTAYKALLRVVNGYKINNKNIGRLELFLKKEFARYREGETVDLAIEILREFKPGLLLTTEFTPPKYAFNNLAAIQFAQTLEANGYINPEVKAYETDSGLRIIISKEHVWHISVSHPQRRPEFDELLWVKETLLPDIQQMGWVIAKSEKMLENCLHLWELITAKI